MVEFVDIKLALDFRRLIKRAQDEFGKEPVFREILKFFAKRSQRMAGEVSKAIRSGEFDLRSRTGSLARSMVGRAVIFDGRPGMQIGILEGPALKYASVQEHGTRGLNPSSPHATIVPKKAKALAIPTKGGPALTPAGVPRYVSPRDYPRPLFFVPILRGNVIGGLYDAQDQKGIGPVNATQVFLLLRKVDIKPHRFLRDGVGRQVPDMVEALARLLKAMLDGRPTGGIA